jgi:hypothetical protein
MVILGKKKVYLPVPSQHSHEKRPLDLNSISIRRFGPARTAVTNVDVYTNTLIAPPTTAAQQPTATAGSAAGSNSTPAGDPPAKQPTAQSVTTSSGHSPAMPAATAAAAAADGVAEALLRPPLYAVGWGWNSEGRCGNITSESVDIPSQVQRSIQMNYISSAAGKHHSLLLSKEG